MKKTFLVLTLVALAALILARCGKDNGHIDKQLTEVSMRLEWYPQAQFAGFLVALDKGWYEDEGLSMEILPAGPDIKPVNTVASGSDDFGVGRPHQVLAARSSDVPLVMVIQIYQDSDLRYVAKKGRGIEEFSDVAGRKVGLWLGGDEYEFLAMLKAAGIPQDEVDIIPQGFQVTPFLENKIDISEVTTYNELNVIRRYGYSNDSLVIFSARDFGVALLSDGLFTTEKMISQQPHVVQSVVNASLRGWKFALEHPREAVAIVMKYNSDLEFDHQFEQLREVNRLIWQDVTISEGLGFINGRDFETARQILESSGQLRRPVDVAASYTLKFWHNTPDSIRQASPDSAFMSY